MVKKSPSTPWPEGAKEKLIELHAAHLSTTHITQAMNRLPWEPDFFFTPNMVSGMVHRLKLVNNRSNGPNGKRTPKVRTVVGFDWTHEQEIFIMDQYRFGRQPPSIADEFFAKFGLSVDRHQVRRRLLALKCYNRAAEVKPKQYKKRSPSAPMHLSIVEDAPPTSVDTSDIVLGRMCPWPTSDDGRQSCGGKVESGAYCLHHAKLAYRSPPSHKRQKAYYR